jgi:hypothetical protein
MLSHGYCVIHIVAESWSQLAGRCRWYFMIHVVDRKRVGTSGICSKFAVSNENEE